MHQIINLLYEQNLSEHALDFLESSKMEEYDIMDYNFRLMSVMSSPHYMDQIKNHSNELGIVEEVKLACSEMGMRSQNLHELNSARKSIRSFSNEPLDFKDLSNLLSLSYSITQPEDQQLLPLRRNIASGGGLYPIDLYFINRHVNGLKKGVFHYNIHNHSLELISNYDSERELEEAVARAFCTKNKTDMDYENAAGYLVLGGMLNRVCFKYMDRGLRFALIDAGAIIHSIYLASAALQIGCCAVGGYFDDLVSKLIGLRGNAQTTLGCVLIGKPKTYDARNAES